jgi:acetyl esterase/lipase
MHRNELGNRYVVLSVLLGICLASRIHAEDAASVKTHRDIVFAEVDGHRLKLDLYLPTGKLTPPLVVWIHGGGWRGGSKNKVPILDLTKHGYAIASISYRFTKNAVFPSQIHDCKAAIRWLRANAEKHGYDADLIAVGGSSAGGHLALLLGVSGHVKQLDGTVGDHADQSSAVQAIIDYFGPSDFVLRGKTQPERAYTEKSGSFALLGGLKNGKVNPTIEKVSSPAHYVSDDDPPLLIFHGKVDTTVLLDQSEHLAKLYAEAGLNVRLVILDKAGHGGKKFFAGPNFDIARKFLDSHRPKRH